MQEKQVFKEGDEVEVISSRELMSWDRGNASIDFKFIIGETHALYYNKGLGCCSDCNTYKINYHPNSLKIISRLVDGQRVPYQQEVDFYPIFN